MYLKNQIIFFLFSSFFFHISLFRFVFVDFVLLSLVSFYFVFISLILFRFVSFLLISFRFVSFSLISFRFVSFLFRFALYRYPNNRVTIDIIDENGTSTKQFVLHPEPNNRWRHVFTRICTCSAYHKQVVETIDSNYQHKHPPFIASTHQPHLHEPILFFD